MSLEPWRKRPHRIVSWVQQRAHLAHVQRGHIASQRTRSLVLLIFGVIRIIAWSVLAVLIGLGLAHVHGFAWAKALAESLPFVVMISIYANWATDLDAATAAFAALVAADASASSEKNRSLLARDFTSLEADIARLAEMQPCAEATALAESIRARLKADG